MAFSDEDAAANLDSQFTTFICSVTLIDVELECEDESEEASEQDCDNDTGTGTELFFSF
jgi:hypothetical protein